MAVTALLTNMLKYHLLNGDPFSLMDLRAMLVLKNGWVPNLDDDFVVTATAAGATELTASGYTRQTLTNQTVTLDDTNDRAVANCDAFTFPGMTPGQSYDTMMIYRQVTDDTDSWLLGIYDLGGVQLTTVMMLRFAIDPLGLFIVN